jgi:hypothetical protein
MSATLTANVSAGVSWTYATALSGGITPTAQSSFTYNKSITNGTGAAGTADLIYAVQGTLAGGANTTLDFAGSLTDFFGTTITMARLKFLFVHLTTDTTSTGLTIGNASSPLGLFSAGTATHTIGNGGIFLIGNSGATGIAITGGSTDGLKLLNADGTNTATYQIAAIGSSA